MKKLFRPLVIGNWKMSPPTENAAKRLFKEIKTGVSKISGTDVAIAPPSVFLSEVHKIRNGSKKIFLGAQEVYKELAGAHTGEISFPMLESFGVKYIIIGHSEKRAEGMTDEQVNKRVSLVLKKGATAVVCVGEKKRDSHGHYLSFVEKQIREALKGVAKTKLQNVVIAYEPIWAIGTGNTATAEDAHEMKLFIQKVLTDIYGRNFAQKIRILYGGSVHAKNAEELIREGMVDGFLVGGASLKPDEFIDVVKTVRKYGA